MVYFQEKKIYIDGKTVFFTVGRSSLLPACQGELAEHFRRGEGGRVKLHFLLCAMDPS